MSIELITMGVSTLGGFALKYLATQAQYRHEQFRDLMKAQDRAEKADGGQGKYVRRFIVLVMMSLLVFIVAGPAFLDINTILVNEGWLWTTTTEIKGIIYDNTIREILVAIIGFYFGTSAATR
jgi:hypothetical protein